MRSPFDHQPHSRDPSDRRRKIARLTLADLFKGKTPQEWKAAYSGAFDWGSDVGHEAVQE
jgi:hypothetical protein